MSGAPRHGPSVLAVPVGLMPPVDDAPILTAIGTTQSPKWRFQTMFSATKFIVAGAIVALVGGFLLTGPLSQRSSDGRQPAAATTTAPSAQASPPGSPAATLAPSEGMTSAPKTSVKTDLLPGVDLLTEEVRPGVFRVLGDGIRDLEAGSGVRDVTVDAAGHVWTLRGGTGNWKVERLGEPGESTHLTWTSKATLGLGADGSPVIGDGSAAITDASRELDLEDGTWVERQTEAPACYQPESPMEPPYGLPLPDGACLRASQWLSRSHRYWQHAPNSDLGLPDDRFIDDLAVGPDGTGWASVRSYSPDTGSFPTGFDGLLHYDGATWIHIPAAPSDIPSEWLAGTQDMAVTPDGTVWIVEQHPQENDYPDVWVRSWDGANWAMYGPSDWPRWSSTSSGSGTGTHVNPDGTIWFLGGNLLFDRASLHPLDVDLGNLDFDLSNQRIGPDGTFAPGGNIWLAATDLEGARQLYVITPEAVTATE
jgi:hypothetical protein